MYRGTADDSPDYDDGLPVAFTWPVLGSTVHPEDFLFTLTNGDQVVPNSAGSCRTGSSTSETRWSSSVTSATEVCRERPTVYPAARDRGRRHPAVLPRA